MSTSPFLFSFDASFIQTAGTLERANFRTGAYPGVDYPTWFSAVAPTQSIATSGGVDVVAMTLVAGQTYVFDVDNGAIDLELDIINQAGVRVAGSDNSSTGSDPFLSFTAATTGTYYVAVHHATNDYLDGSFRWEGTPGPTGSYKLAISTPSLPPVTTLTAYSDTRSFTDSAQTVRSLGGNDTLYLNGGNDLAQAGDGDDTVFGGLGDDEISGGNGVDRLNGDGGADVLRGDAGADILRGGLGRDSLNGGFDGDVLYGGDDNDQLWGDSGNDSLYGEAGNDTLRGGTGIDSLFGGAGADSFHFLPGEALYGSTALNQDRIQDFAYEDVIDLSDMVWGTLGWRGTAGFTAANQVRISDLRSVNGYQEVQINLDSDATPEAAFLVKTVGNFALISSDFIL